jgi:Protein of unknown function (DUF2807).
MRGLFFNGDIVTQTRPIADTFKVIDMHDNISVKLVQDDNTFIEVTSGEYVIDKLTGVVENDTLTIRNENKMNWLRDYNCPLEMTIHYKNLKSINFYSVGNLTNIDSIRGYPRDNSDNSFKEFFLKIHEGSGDIDLTVNCIALHTMYKYGTSKVTLRGIAKLHYISTNSFGSVHAENLFGNITFLTTKSTNDTFVWSGKYLEANIYSIGNVYYKGPIDSIKSNTPNEGRLYPLKE